MESLPGRKPNYGRMLIEMHFATPYDALLDLYCTGDSRDTFIREVFDNLKKELPPIG